MIQTADPARGSKIVTFYDQDIYAGQNYTLFQNRLHYCVDYNKGPLIVKSARLFLNTVCDLYTFVFICPRRCPRANSQM